MNDRPADVIYSTGATEGAPGPVPASTAKPTPNAERPADRIWGPPPPPPPEPKVVARATQAKSPGEIMYEEGSEPAEGATPKGDQPDAAEAETAPTMLVELLPGYALNVPSDGRFTEFDQQGLDQMAPILQRHEIKHEAAQELFNLHLQQLEQESRDAQHALLEQQDQQRDEIISKWRQQCKSDPDLRAYGLAEARSHGREVLQTYFSKEFREVLGAFGLTNHPEFVKGLLKMREQLVGNRVRRAGYDYKARIK